MLYEEGKRMTDIHFGFDSNSASSRASGPPTTRRGDTVEFQTERLLLRRAKAADAIPLAEIWADREVTRYMGGRPRDFEEVRFLVEDEVRACTVGRSTGWWAVVEKASGQVVGDCGLVEKDVDGYQEIELVYVFASHSWGKGYATEAASVLRDYAFYQLRLQRIIALIDPENHASV